MSEADLSYYERRAREEEALAAAALSPEAASAHRQLAVEYASQSRKLGSRALFDREEALGAAPYRNELSRAARA